MAFVSQQSLLNGESSAIADKFPVASDDPMTGDDDRNGVLPVCRSHGTAGLGPADRFRDLSVGQRSSIGDGLKGLPDALLKRGSPRSQVDRERFASPGKIFVELPDGSLKGLVRIGPPGVRFDRMPAVLEREVRQCMGIARQEDPADGAWYDTIGNGIASSGTLGGKGFLTGDG